MFDLNTIYSEMYGKIFTYISHKIHVRETAEELANDVFLKAHKHSAEFNPDLATASTWLHNIAKNTVIDYLRRKKLNTVSMHSVTTNGDEDGYDGIDFRYVLEISNNSTPHVEMVRKELKNKMLKVFRKLPKKRRRAFNLFYNHQYKIDDISEKMNENSNTIKGWLMKSRDLFKEECSITI